MSSHTYGLSLLRRCQAPRLVSTMAAMILTAPFDCLSDQ
jgi:hypothetical protein